MSERIIPPCPDCGAAGEIWKQEIEENWTGVLIVDYLICTNPQCKNHTPPETPPNPCVQLIGETLRDL